MHKWSKCILECVKEKADEIGIENFSGQALDDFKDWTEIAKNIVQFEKDYKIIESMEEEQHTDLDGYFNKVERDVKSMYSSWTPEEKAKAKSKFNAWINLVM